MYATAGIGSGAWNSSGDIVDVPSSDAICQALDAIEPGLGDTLRARYGFVPAIMDYEVELGMILLEDVRPADLEREGFAPRIGFFVANDLTARACQVLGDGRPDAMPYWSVAKSFPGFLPVGASMFVPDRPALDGWPDVRLETWVNGRIRQSASTVELAFTPRQILRYAARAAGRDLARGEALLTGTPSGVAFRVAAWKRRIADVLFDRFEKLEASISTYIDDPSFLWPGDRVEVSAGMLGERAVTMGAGTRRT
jgi:2-keto-4-pentenoate hydratase/2-oxohepta-3-ene-1,7-dioic acid hydratase in catechol pathway